ncbi:hypothetical protein, partial [Vibrio cholerae]|uniref:hypothetical protein n=1 Tax=Vibrio cholerae TaxID=666 RepID=UPI0031F58A70
WFLFFLLECDSKLTHYHPNWLNFNSDNYPARGGHDEFERSEYFIGLGFVAIQQYFVETILLTNLNKSKAYTVGPKLSDGVPFASLVNACANWWKHEPEWFNKDELKDDAQRTIKRVLKFSNSNDFALSNVLAFLIDNKSCRFTYLIPKIQEWSECVANSE